MTDNIDKIKMEVPFFQVPNDIFDLDIEIVVDERTKIKGSKEINSVKRPLKTYEKLIYIYLCRCGNNGGQAFPSYNTIAKQCGVSRGTAIEAISTLIKNGLLDKRSRTKEGSNEDNSNEYFVIKPKKELYSTPSIPPSTPSEPQGSTPSIPPSTPSEPKKEQHKKNQLKKEPLNNSVDWNKIQDKYFEVYRVLPSGTEIKQIQSYMNDGITEEVIIHAFDYSKKKEANNFSYTKKILDSYMSKDIKTMDDIRKQEQKESKKQLTSTLENIWSVNLEG